MATSDNEWIAYLQGEPAESLSAHERGELDHLRALLRDPAVWTEPDPGLEERVVGAIAQEAAGRPERRRTGRRSLRLGWVTRRPAFGVAALVAAAAAIAAMIIIAVGRGDASRAPLRFAMVVSGTPAAPGAHGSAKLTKTASGWEIQLSVTGLPHVSGSRYYQAWLRNPSGILVPVGTFNDARRVTLWSGVPVTVFRTLTVTRQRLGGSQAPSGDRVLIGTIRGAR